MPGNELRLLAIDGGGVRGLSSLMILQQLLSTIDPDSPPKPCDYFDLIGGTSTGGLIAIMLGRLRMTLEECIDAYVLLSEKIFEKKSHSIRINGKFQGRFDSMALEQAVKQTLADRGMDDDTLLKDSPDAACKVFVCAMRKETSETVCLTSYRSTRGLLHLYHSTRIWEACRATSAATTFFDHISIGQFGEEFVDGALGDNNPVSCLWNQAQDIWGADELQCKLRCLVSIGTGVPSMKPFLDDVLHIGDSLIALATETQKTAEQFRRDHSDLDNNGRYYRFNVDRGLENIGLEEAKKKNMIAAATDSYLKSQEVYKRLDSCAKSLSEAPQMALEELRSLLDKARAQTENGRSKVQDSAEKLRANDAKISATVNAFLAFLRSLLWYIGTPLVMLMMLESMLDANSLTLQGVITSDQKIAEELQHEGEDAQKTLDELKRAEDFIQGQNKVPAQKTNTQSNSEEVQLLEAILYTRIEERDDEEEREQQRLITEEAEKIQRQKEENAKLKEQVPELRRECRKLQQTVEQLEAERAQTQAKVAKLEAKQQEAERIRREYEGKTVWQKIWAWIYWLVTCGSDE